MNKPDRDLRMPSLAWPTAGSAQTVHEAKLAVMVSVAGFLAEEGVREIAVEHFAVASASAPRSTVLLARNADLPGVLMSLSSGSTLRFRLMNDRAMTLHVRADGLESVSG